MNLEEFLLYAYENNKNINIDKLREAYLLAAEAHEGQKRISGEPYIIHPAAVACILIELGMDDETVIAGLLHDVAEDTKTGLDVIERKFGPEVAALVDGVTKLSRIEYISKEERQIESYRKMFMAMASDVRVIFIKLADRLHNMRTLNHQSFWKQREIARETLEIFAPLASRLGIFKIKWELEDLSFRFLHPDRYYELVEKISMKRKEREEYIKKLVTVLKEELKKADINFDISGRPKHFYSIYNKMENKGKSLGEIYDLIAVRILVDSVKDCYGALGVIHSLWKPIPGRFKDFIAMPKPNMYQSLHTTVIGPEGEPFEIQIRTWEMHKTAEYGIAAHWMYKEGKASAGVGENLAWLGKIREWQNELQDSKEFVETLKIDLFSDEVFVFSPRGDVFELPQGSTPVDFAYRVHTEVGHRCIGSKVNHRIVPLDYRLNTGDIVEVLTSRQSGGPSRDWIKIARTSQAKNKIRQWFRKEKRDENIARGREHLEKEIKRNEFSVSVMMKTDYLQKIAVKQRFKAVDDLLAAIGDGALTALQVLKGTDEFMAREAEKKEEKIEKKVLEDTNRDRKRKKSSSGIRVRGMDNVEIRFSGCCNPLPGDDIIGYITRGKGVSIHRTDCPNIKYFKEKETHRLIEAAWDEMQESTFQVELHVMAMNRPKLAMDIMAIVQEQKIVLNAINARNKKGHADVELKLEIRSLEQLHTIKNRIQAIKDVISVERVTRS